MTTTDTKPLFECSVNFVSWALHEISLTRDEENNKITLVDCATYYDDGAACGTSTTTWKGHVEALRQAADTAKADSAEDRVMLKLSNCRVIIKDNHDWLWDRKPLEKTEECTFVIPGSEFHKMMSTLL